MQRPREEIDTDAIFADRLGPTRYRTATNRHELACGVCGEPFFVDDDTYGRVAHALELDPSDTPFSCAGCEVEYEGEEHGV